MGGLLDRAGGRSDSLVLGHQFPPTQVTDSSTLQSETQLSLASGKRLLPHGLNSELHDAPSDGSGQVAGGMPALEAVGVADVQGRIVESSRWFEEAGLRPKDERDAVVYRWDVLVAGGHDADPGLSPGLEATHPCREVAVDSPL